MSFVDWLVEAYRGWREQPASKGSKATKLVASPPAKPLPEAVAEKVTFQFGTCSVANNQATGQDYRELFPKSSPMLVADTFTNEFYAIQPADRQIFVYSGSPLRRRDAGQLASQMIGEVRGAARGLLFLRLGNTEQIFSVNGAEASPGEVQLPPDGRFEISWSSTLDKVAIFYPDHKKLVIHRASTGEVEDCWAWPSSPSWLGDGRSLLYWSASSRLARFDVESGLVTEYAILPAAVNQRFFLRAPAIFYAGVEGLIRFDLDSLVVTSFAQWPESIPVAGDHRYLVLSGRQAKILRFNSDVALEEVGIGPDHTIACSEDLQGHLELFTQGYGAGRFRVVLS